MISIIVPAYNEEKRIKDMLDLYTNYFFPRYPDSEFLVVCDGNDSTQEIVQRMAQDRRIVIMEYGNRLGKGGAIMEGFRKARGNMVAFVDADESVSPRDLEKIINELKTEDCAIGSRRIQGSNITVRQPLKRVISSKVFNILVNLLFNLNIRDTQCGAKAFRKEVITGVLRSLKLNGFEFDVELLWRLKSAGCRIKEVPIQWQHSEYSRFSLKNAPSMFVNLLKIRFEK